MAATAQRVAGKVRALGRRARRRRPGETDPLRGYEALRQTGPVVHLPQAGHWIVLGLAEAKLVLKDSQRFSSRPFEPIDIALLSASPPRHTEVRRLIASRFSTRALDELVTGVEAHAASLLVPPIDVVAGYARPVSCGVAAQLVGLDEADSAIMAEAGAVEAFPFLSQSAAWERVGHHSRLQQEMLRDAGNVLSPIEVASLARLLWVASTSTTERLITSCVHRLLHHEAVRRRLEAEPELLPAFIDEVIRLHPPEATIKREATEDVDIGGVTIPAQSFVQIALSAVNRDPAQFADPAELRLDRGHGRHVGFGTGPHTCIGAALARRTVRVAIATLLRELPSFRSPAGSLPPLQAGAPRRLLIEA
jgi:cytochrome P450